MTSVYFIGENSNHDKCLLHIQDATGKKKLAPDRSGNVMVRMEKAIFLAPLAPGWGRVGWDGGRRGVQSRPSVDCTPVLSF